MLEMEQEAVVGDLDVVIDLRERVVVNLVGELDLLCGPQFEERILPSVRGRSARDVLIDCSDIGFVDLRGLDLLLQVSLASLPHGRVTLRNPNLALRKLLEYTKCQEVFAVEQVD